MKTIFKTSILIFLFAAVISSCKKNENVAEDNTYTNSADSTETTIDTVGPNSDTTNTSTNGTTGAVGEGSTGSGSDGTTQKGSTSVKTDSTSNSKGSK